MALGQVTHVIFDVDGTLLNTEDIYTEVFDHITVEMSGKRFDMEVKQKMMGRHRLEAFVIFKESYGIPNSIEEIDTYANSLLYQKFPNCTLMPGVERLIKHLYAHGIPMAVATGSDTESFALKTARCRDFFEKYFDHVVLTSDPEVKHGKPAPDVFLVAAHRFKTPPASMGDVIVFEDAVNGVEAALKAEMKCVWIPSLKVDTSILPATIVLPSMENFKPELFGLPPFPVENGNAAAN